MSDSYDSDATRIRDLLADQTMFGLESEEHDELEGLLDRYPDHDASEYELVAATLFAANYEDSIDFASSDAVDRISAGVAAAIRSGSENVDGASMEDLKQPTSAANYNSDMNRSRQSSQTKIEKRQTSTKPAGSPREVIAWMFAAAALLIALFAWLDRMSWQTPRQSAGEGEPPEQVLSQEAMLAERSKLVDEFEDAVPIEWQVNDATYLADGVESVDGDLVWSDEAQSGYLSIRGLAVNDKAESSYQLWIFDRNQSPDTPVDGGVFHISDSDQMAVIPIHNKLYVDESYFFAITVEGPHGTVVSDRLRLPLTATPAEQN